LSVQCSVFIACNVDGYIARPDGSIDWLTGPGSSTSTGDYGYSTFLNTIDAVVLGRKTYELVETFAEWPYGSRRVYVLSTRYPEGGKPVAGGALGISVGPSALVERMSTEGIHRAYIDGGKTVQGFLAAGLIDDITITRVPILLGSGIPLFGTLSREVGFRHLETTSYTTGLVQSRYEVMRTAAKH